MILGTYGKIVFETSKNKVLTFSSMKETSGSTWATHKTLSGKPRRQFISGDLQTVDLDITVRADLGYKPREIIEQLKQMAEDGTAELLVIGGRQVTPLPLVITSVSAEWDTVYQQGELFQATLKLTLEEYR